MAGLTIRATGGDTVILNWKSETKTSGLFPRADVYDNTFALVTTVNLSEIANSQGLYTGTYTPDGSKDHLVVNYRIFTDSARTVESDVYEGDVDYLFVHSAFAGIAAGGSTELSDADYQKLQKMIRQEMTNVIVRGELSRFNPATDVVKASVDFSEIQQHISTTAERLQDSLGKQVIDLRPSMMNLGTHLREFHTEMGTMMEHLMTHLKALPLPKDYQPMFQQLQARVDMIRMPEVPNHGEILHTTQTMLHEHMDTMSESMQQMDTMMHLMMDMMGPMGEQAVEPIHEHLDRQDTFLANLKLVVDDATKPAVLLKGIKTMLDELSVLQNMLNLVYQPKFQGESSHLNTVSAMP